MIDRATQLGIGIDGSGPLGVDPVCWLGYSEYRRDIVTTHIEEYPG